MLAKQPLLFLNKVVFGPGSITAHLDSWEHIRDPANAGVSNYSHYVRFATRAETLLEQGAAKRTAAANCCGTCVCTVNVLFMRSSVFMLVNN